MSQVSMKSHPLANLFPIMSDAEYVSLRDDIKSNGLLEPIWIWQGQIIDGRHRFRACEELGIDCDQREYVGEDPVQFVVSLNLKRRHLNESQRAMVAASVANMRQGERTDIAQICATSQDDAAKLLGVSRRSVQTAVAVKNDGAAELVEAVQVGKVSVSAAADVATLPKAEQTEIVARGAEEILEAAKRIRAERSTEVRAKNDQIRREAVKLPVPAGRYRTMVIDPPWPMEIFDRDVRPGQLAMPYPTMSIDEICAIDLPLADDATVFMWTTQKFLQDSFRVLSSWGLKYLCTMVWHKAGGPQPFNLPQYNCEFVLIGRKGTPVFMDTKQFFLCNEWPRREHSRKPDEFYDLVRRVCPEPRIDYFSREKREGFDQHGAETGKFAA